MLDRHYSSKLDFVTFPIILPPSYANSILGNPEGLILKIYSRRRQPWWRILSQYSYLSTNQNHMGTLDAGDENLFQLFHSVS